METPIEWIRVFLEAEAAHRKIAHGGVFMIIRKLVDYSESRSTVCAGYEEIAISGIVWVSEFSKTLVAYCDIWRNYGARVF
jgi:hypothetical protein